jgi:hypothetical protein
MAFAASVTILLALLLVAAIWQVPRRPVLAAALPLAAAALHWFVALRVVWWGAPEFLPLDRRPIVWLGVTALGSAAALLITARLALRRDDRDPPEGTSARRPSAR